jgi:hypothetical protein
MEIKFKIIVLNICKMNHIYTYIPVYQYTRNYYVITQILLIKSVKCKKKKKKIYKFMI